MNARITWTTSRLGHSEEGRVGGLNLFRVGYGTRRSETMYYLETDLPARSAKYIGQKYIDANEAKAAAERFLSIFIALISKPKDEDA